MGRSSQIRVVALEDPPLERIPVEMVERKGRGHPDTLCDQAAEAFSLALCREYLSRSGRILHHNVDKGILCAGAARVEYGGGEVIAPVRIVQVGRAMTRIDGSAVPVDDLGRRACREIFRRSLRFFDPDRHLEVSTMVRPTSADLGGLFGREQAVPLANDTSMGAGYAPLSETERLVLELDALACAPATLERFPFLGEDVKILAIRTPEEIRITIAAAFVARHVRSLAQYLEAKRSLAETFSGRAKEIATRPIHVEINTADDPDSGQIYLTVTGTSAESGDDGQVGRGNRANGLITPSRPMTLEAVAGKNPVTHVGKLYNLWAHRLCVSIAGLPGVEEVHCQIASRIGAPITEPQVVLLRVRGPGGRDEEQLRRHVRRELDVLPDLWLEIVAGEVTVC